MSNKRTDEEILAAARKIGDKWLEAATFTGKYNPQEVERILNQRVHNNEPIVTTVVHDLDELNALLKTPEFAEYTRAEVNARVWHYWLMAYFDYTYSQCEDQSHEFGRQSFLSAFAAGLGYYINFGNRAIGVLRPEAHRDLHWRLQIASWFFQD